MFRPTISGERPVLAGFNAGGRSTRFTRECNLASFQFDLWE